MKSCSKLAWRRSVWDVVIICKSSCATPTRHNLASQHRRQNRRGSQAYNLGRRGDSPSPMAALVWHIAKTRRLRGTGNGNGNSSGVETVRGWRLELELT